MASDRRFDSGPPGPLPPPPTWERVLQRNSIERLKRERQPHAVLDDLDRLATAHYLDIPEEDLVRLKWWGLYHDKPKVGAFMLRIKVPAGLLPPASLRAVGELSVEQGEGYAELTTRQNVQLHFVRLAAVPAILARLADAGLTTAGACGDAVRNITGCPLEGILREEAFDATPLVEEAARFFYGNPDYMDLPRKHKITISTCPYQCDMPEINCIALVGVVREGCLGFAVRVGGGLSTVPRLSRDLGVFVPTGEALEVLRALLDVWKEDLRYRLSRVKARFKFMVDDHGPEGIRALVEERLGRRLEDGAAPESRAFTDHLGVNEQRQPGLFHVGVPVPAGIVSGTQLVAVADLAGSLGGDVRLTKQQNLVLTGVPRADLDRAVARLSEIGLPVDANPLRATAIACTGEPHCTYSGTETKGKLQEIVAHLEARWGDRLGGFRLNLDGCPHACALHWVGDVGL
ncbi:MAG: nitrite/sulfite reductase, partial [Actinobacteria bacterium]|nr:nitrite/sulfite reductase [Actinomycetota bacterium]